MERFSNTKARTTPQRQGPHPSTRKPVVYRRQRARRPGRRLGSLTNSATRHRTGRSTSGTSGRCGTGRSGTNFSPGRPAGGKLGDDYRIYACDFRRSSGSRIGPGSVSAIADRPPVGGQARPGDRRGRRPAAQARRPAGLLHRDVLPALLHRALQGRRTPLRVDRGGGPPVQGHKKCRAGQVPVVADRHLPQRTEGPTTVEPSARRRTPVRGRGQDASPLAAVARHLGVRWSGRCPDWVNLVERFLHRERHRPPPPVARVGRGTQVRWVRDRGTPHQGGPSPCGRGPPGRRTNRSRSSFALRA